MSKMGLKLILTGLVLILIVLGASSWLRIRDDRLATEANLRQAQQTEEAAQTISGDVRAATVESRRVDEAVSRQRATNAKRYEDIRDASPTVRAYTDTPRPMQLRELARKRREDLERFGGDAAGDRSSK